MYFIQQRFNIEVKEKKALMQMIVQNSDDLPISNSLISSLSY